MALPDRDHRISLTDAAALTQAYRDAKVSDVKAAAFAGDQVLQLLNQTGCVGIRIYYGRNPDASPSLVLAGTDASDSDVTQGVMLEQNWPCPPLCGAANPLNS